MAIMGTALAAAGINGNGTPEQVMEWVPQCYGDTQKLQLGAFCVSEPDAGSDVSSLRTRAVYDEANDEWVLNGTKAWITNGGIADVHVVVAAVDPELKGRGQASFIVPPGTKGLSMGQKYKKHGIRASHTAEVVLDDCRVPGRCLLGGKEKLDAKLARAREMGHSGEKQPAMTTFEATRPAVGAQALGIARAAYEYALDYAKERKAFGKPIVMHQAIAFKLANMAVEIDAARLLIWRAAWLARNGGFKNGEGSMSKYKASEVAVRVTEDAIQILGGYGYTREYPVERWHRDAKIHTIFEGTSEIQQLVIARAISGLRIESTGSLPFGHRLAWADRSLINRPTSRPAVPSGGLAWGTGLQSRADWLESWAVRGGSSNGGGPTIVVAPVARATWAMRSKSTGPADELSAGSLACR